METKLYYTEDEIMSKPHFNFVNNGSNLYLHQKSGDFEIYKKLFLLKKDASELTEVYVKVETYLAIKVALEERTSRWMNEFDAYVFHSVKDYFEKLDEASKNRLF